MPLSDDHRLAQTQAFAKAFLDQPPLTGDPNGGDRRWDVLGNVQAALCLGLGVEIGFFSRDLAHRYLGLIATRLITTLHLVDRRLPMLVNARLAQLMAGKLGAPSYRGELRPSDGAIIAFRSVMISLVALRSQRNEPSDSQNLATFFERARFADDWESIEGQMGKRNVNRDSIPSQERSPLVDTCIAALDFLKTATMTLESADRWAEHDEQSWLRPELAMLYQTQIDTSESRLRGRLLMAADHLVDITADEAEAGILRSSVSLIEQASALQALSRSRDAWREEATEIVRRFDASLPVMATATA